MRPHYKKTVADLSGRDLDLRHFQRPTPGTTSMPAIIVCPSCQRKLKIPETTLGKTIQCPGCQESFAAQAADEEKDVEPDRSARRVKRRSTKKKPKSYVLLWVLLGVGGVLLLVIGGVVAILL